jgi:hypothetical protein
VPHPSCFPFILALTLVVGPVACDDAPKAQTPPRQASVSAHSPAAKPDPAAAEAAPIAPAADPAAQAEPAPSGAADDDPPTTPPEAVPTPAGEPSPAKTTPAGKDEPSTPAPGDGGGAGKTSARAGSKDAAAPPQGRRVEHFTECERSETFADGRCYSTHQVACEALGCTGKCAQLKSMPSQAVCR